MKPTSVSVVVPVYRAADCIEELCSRLIVTLEPEASSFEILLIEDEGNGDCWPIICSLSARDERIKGIRFSRNFGQHHAITAGLDHCIGDWVIVMDCDLQHPPEALPGMLAKAMHEKCIVFGRRLQRIIPLRQRFTSWLFYKLLAFISPIRLESAMTNFSVVPREVVEVLRGMREHLRFYGGMIAWAGFDYVTVEYQHQPRFAGKSSYNFLRRLRLGLRNTFAYSNIPLIYSTFVGIGFSALAFLMAVFYLVNYVVRGDAPAGWTTLAVAVFFIGGFIIFQVGISGIYLGEVFNEVRRRPLYIVSEVAGFEGGRSIYRFGRLPKEEP